MKTIPKSMSLRMRKSFVIWMLAAGLAVSCGKNGQEREHSAQVDTTTSSIQAKKEVNEAMLKNKGIGPVQSLTLEEINPSLSEHGKLIYELKCSACHKWESPYVGPPLKGITERRSPEWIMNMILNPVEMTKKDPIAKKLLDEYHSQMTYQDVKEDEARALLEFFRMEDRKK